MSGFNDIIGQEHIKEHLKSAIETKQVGHAYIFNGERGCGKNFVAKIFARTLLCEMGGSEPCENCPSCKKALGENNPDIIRLVHEKPNTISVDDIREQINATVQIKPYGNRKIYIIEDAEKMNPQAQNALLKTLEEPPEYVTILLLTVNAQMLLQTIRSRCVQLNMRPVENKLIRAYLMKSLKITDYKADMCIAFARGNVGRAKLLADSEEFENIRNEAVALLRNIHKMEIDELIQSIKRFAEYKVDMEEFFDILTIWYRDVLLYKATMSVGDMTFKDELSDIRQQAERTSYEGIEIIIESIEKTKTRLKANVNFELALELLLLAIKENN